MFDFSAKFEQLTGSPPFPWQAALFERMTTGKEVDIPSVCHIPTGLGKTSIIAIWLLALARRPNDLPTRLAYVVNRRTVVDQTTTEVERIKKNLSAANLGIRDLMISTLRGQFADNREWSKNPALPAVISGTVDMIGSRLLFSGYGVGFKARPLHAGFLGQDTLLVHDEAHLEPAFQKLLESIMSEQQRERSTSDVPWRPLQVMQLSATIRSDDDKSSQKSPPFGLSPSDEKHPVVKQRLQATKTMTLQEVADEKKPLVEAVVARALELRDSNRTVIIFLRKLDHVESVQGELEKKKLSVQFLTGTQRGYERQQMADPTSPTGCPIFARFLPPPKANDSQSPSWKVTPAAGTVYLICTSAGEVGVNLSADHLICDLSTYESMAQRFGRVNRFGDRDDSSIHVIYPSTFTGEDVFSPPREKTLLLLRQLEGDASPAALSKLYNARSEEVHQAFTPLPTILPATDILFDTWALTSIKGELPGRPPVEPYLHGIETWEPPQTTIAWREEVDLLNAEVLKEHPPEQLLEEFPLLPHELVVNTSERAFKHLAKLAERHPETIVWMIDRKEKLTLVPLKEVANKDRKERIEHCTILLPPSIGGLNSGLLDGDSEAPALDVSCKSPTSENKQRSRLRVTEDELPSFLKQTREMRVVRQIVLEVDESDTTTPVSQVNTQESSTLDDLETESTTSPANGKIWLWLATPARTGLGTLGSKAPIGLQHHVDDVVRETEQILKELKLPEKLKAAVRLAAKYHDEGKRRPFFQMMLGNRNFPDVLLAKSQTGTGRITETYRHEFGSLRDITHDAEFNALEPHDQDIVLHLIAAHHGRARPHFSADEAFDPFALESESIAFATEIPRRFARLQRHYGRWGLAYLESILRAADYAASAHPSSREEPVHE
ncbi:CRISPR-associated helicase Cas3, Anaes-subtype [Planctopirus limnophila DSM 3776]|uniref:CRISPR-associated helicase Cas3, Anaes-subtype n=1 Tax=Planctopirus limnophila (strain ATCC 43296 / DSM 3776 / IFAM 1008 / Mu 290) TaxID=521674 RepID=D5ST11_PLAL2|nr:type I-U CRISPR-associated helicase/endonuclease Cas3 [Planctopirus limnophila]ADG68962.1 CRISPR-associated helicase Cas3, Anaes-subtype [Planctopirus limnophila DSM 3776]